VEEIPMSCVAAAAALAVMLYVADFDKSVARELCEDTPETVRALIADAARWSALRGVAIDPRYYMKLAVALKAVVEVWQESKRV
jgi:preprotein translocase subunit Sec61beta